MSKTKKIIGSEGVFVCDKTHVDFHKTSFCLDFLTLYNIYIENSFVNKVMGIKWIVFEEFMKYKTKGIDR